MSDTAKLGPWVRRLLLEHLVSERNLARNTQRSYRDTLALLIPFIAGKVHKPIDQLDLDHVSAERVRQFLQSLEQTRGCSVATRNQRLAVIHVLAHFIGQRCPERIEWCGQLRAIPFKRTAQTPIAYLDKPEMDALLAAPDRSTTQGRRDYALLLFLYNTGARADEAAHVLLMHLPRNDSPSGIVNSNVTFVACNVFVSASCADRAKQFSEEIAHSSDVVLKRLVITLQDGAARILPTARVDTKAFAFLPTLLRGFRQMPPTAPHLLPDRIGRMQEVR